MEARSGRRLSVARLAVEVRDFRLADFFYVFVFSIAKRADRRPVL